MDKYIPEIKNKYVISIEKENETFFLNWKIETEPYSLHSHTKNIEKVSFELLQQPSKNITVSESLSGFFEALRFDSVNKKVLKTLLDQEKLSLSDFKVQEINGREVIIKNFSLDMVFNY